VLLFATFNNVSTESDNIFKLMSANDCYCQGVYVARRGAHLADERSPSAARADGARRSVAVPNGEGVASGSATLILFLHLLTIHYHDKTHMLGRV